MVSVGDLMENKAPINSLKLKKLQNHSLSLTKKQKGNWNGSHWMCWI